MNPEQLPVYRQKQKILDTLEASQVIVVESPTGSGKTTQIPQILYQAGYARSGVIGVTQPRRIAAISVTEFIARQLNLTVPGTVGYKMRFEDNTDVTTRIKIMTDGILLQEIKADYYLSRYSVLMVDEAHERSLNIDFILGLLKRILSERGEFKVIISSATINAEVFSEYFDECPIVKIETRAYPIQLVYDKPDPEDDYEALMGKITETVRKIAVQKEPGDVLVFLSGERDIKECIARLSGLRESKRLQLLPLYARLSSRDQQSVFADYRGKRKVIVATNIAETSVTIDGVTYGIDSGRAKLNFYNRRTFTSSLVEVPISRASCNQRRGRSGRTAPGTCYRLYDRRGYESRPLFTQEEIFRTDLSEVVLRMAEIGIQDFENFDFLSPPGQRGILSAVETLKRLEAIDEGRQLTNIGKMMIRFPMLPQHSRIIVEAIHAAPHVIEEVLIASSFLTTKSPFLLPQGEEMAARKAHHNFRDPYGDFISYLKILRAYAGSHDKTAFCRRYYLDFEVMAEIANIKAQLEEIVSEMGVPVLSGGDVSDYLCAVGKGLIQFVCGRSGRGIYSSATAEKIFIHPGSVMFDEKPDYIVAGEIVKTSRMFARSVSPLQPAWLKRISPRLYESMVPGAGRGGKTRNVRDFTNQVKIGTQTFPIVKEKGKKVVVLRWENLKAAMKDFDLSLLPDYKNLRGKILFGRYEIMGGTRMNYLLATVRHVDPERNVIQRWPRGQYSYPDSSAPLCDGLEQLLCLCSRKKKSRRLGFLALSTDRNGLYWFTSVKAFYNALTDSIASLEKLIDEVAGSGDTETIDTINAAFRRLSAMLED